MKTLVICLICLLLGACATNTDLHDQRALLFDDAAFNAPSEYVGADQIFAISPAMADLLAKDVLFNKDPRHTLINALFHKGRISIEYDSEITRTAAQTFEAKRGNCLSLVLMTAAMAKRLGLSVKYRRLDVNPEVTRVQGVEFFAGHVDIVISEKESSRSYNTTETVVDFIPSDALHPVEKEDIEEKTIIAMYMNNRAAEAISVGNLDNAYWWAKAAILSDGGFVSAYNTLGVIYQAHRNYPQSELLFRKVLAEKSDDVIAMSNLSNLLKATGRIQEATILKWKVQELQPVPPFFYFDLGLAAMKVNDYQAAEGYFRREIAREPEYHLFQFWMALAEFKQGDSKGAEKYLTQALKNSTTRRESALYAAKLDALKAMRKDLH